jgi:hypothetical protein
MLGINLHRNLQKTKRPNRSGRVSTLNGQLPLDRAAYMKILTIGTLNAWSAMGKIVMANQSFT